MAEDDPPEHWHEVNTIFGNADPEGDSESRIPDDLYSEAVKKQGSGVYTPDGEPRDRGIFTHADREYIIGERQSDTPQQRSNVRGRHVQRLSDAIQDFQLLLRLDDLTKDRIFEGAPVPWVHQTLRDVVRFYYEGMDRDKEIVENAVTSAVWEAEGAADEGEVKTVESKITIEQAPDPETALEMFENGEYTRLTLEQIGVLAREGLLDEDDWQKLEWPAFGEDELPFPPASYGDVEDEDDDEE